MKQSTIIILGKGQTFFLSKEIINNQSTLPLIINRGCNQFNQKMKKNTRAFKLKYFNLIIEHTNN
jgi:hypothetical protein